MLLHVENLESYFFLDEGTLKAVDGVSFHVDEKETVGLVGESGCGKTIVALSLLNLIPPPGRIVGGRILIEGEDLRSMDAERLRQIRGGSIGIVFQEPGAALNPVFTVGHQIAEVLRLHRGLGKREAETEAIRLLGETGIAEPEKRARQYPFEFSGGMRQRAVIAIALSGRPRLLIADEPTTALDVTVQAEIIELLGYLQEQYRMAILLITHDLAVVAEMADRVMVMYTGKIVEVAPTQTLFQEPKHPYTRALVHSIPRVGTGHKEPLRGIPGAVPDFLELPTGCTFHPRCPIADHACRSTFPAIRSVGPERLCACHMVNDV
jgi:oligopeptide/dipeptide ABC transporter ATP-binding protein